VLHIAVQKLTWNRKELQKTVADSLDMPQDLRNIILEKQILIPVLSGVAAGR